MANLMDAIRPMLSGGVMDAIGKLVGASPESAGKVLQTAVPASITGLSGYASTGDGAQNLLNRFKNNDYPSLDADSIGKVLSDPQASSQLLQSSEGVLGKLFGGRLNGITEALSAFTGSGGSVSSKLLGLAMPMVLGAVGKHAIGNQLDGKGLSGFLGEQSNLVSSFLPGPLKSLLGQAAPSVAAATPSAAVERFPRVPQRGQPVHKTGSSVLPWAIAALAALLFVGWLFGRRTKHAEVSRNLPRPEYNVPREEVNPVAGTNTVAGISQYLDSNKTTPKRFALEDLQFDTGSAQLSPDASQTVGELAGTLRDHPNAKIRIEGFSDAEGNQAPDAKKAWARADTVRQKLESRGVPSNRIEVAASTGRPQTPSDRIEVVVSPR
jgi:outer membrane protein OmpA-like peptidoglycan-associated protein